MHLRAAVQQLYAARLVDFMEVRKALVAEAKTAGDVELSRTVGRLRKPTVAAWAVNHFVRERPGELDELGRFAELLREAQRSLDGDALRALGRERSRRVDETAAKIEEAAAAGGQPLGTSVALEIRETLTAFVADEEAERTIRTGALVKALSYSGFGSVDIADAVAIDPEPRPASSGERAGDEAGGRARADASVAGPSQPVDDPIDLAERRRAKRQRDRRRLVAGLESAERALAKTDREVDVARARQVEAHEGLADLERRLAAARGRLEKATGELEELTGIRAERLEAERAARAALDSFDAEDGGEGENAD